MQALVNAPHKTRDTDEFERLAKKFCSEHAGKVGNAWLVLYYVGRYVGWSVGSTAKLTPLTYHSSLAVVAKTAMVSLINIRVINH